MTVRTDLHLHSCLSPCGDLSMSPAKIAEALAARGVQLAALTDHNSALNCPAFADACAKRGIVPLFGIEAQTREECHVLCLFPRVDQALALGEELYALMPDVPNVPERMGDQVYVDVDENIIGEVEKYLVASADLGLEDLAARALALGGLVIPAHVDRPAFSLTSQLGFVPDGPWDALELVRMPPDDGQPPPEGRLDTRGYPLITSSDAHYLEHVGRRAFDLDLAGDALLGPDGLVCVEAMRAALARRPR